MATTWDIYHVQKYHDDIMMTYRNLLKITDAAKQNTSEGKYGFYNYLGELTPAAISGTGITNTRRDTPVHTRRRYTTTPYTSNPVVSLPDLNSMGWIDPKSSYVTTKADGIMNLGNSLFISAFTATAYEGETGSDSVAYDTDNDVTITSGTTQTVANTFGAMGEILDENGVPLDERYIVCSPAQKTKFMAMNQVVSADYVRTKPYTTGEMPDFYGFKIFVVPSSYLTPPNGYSDVAYFWHRDAMLFTIGAAPNGNFSEITQLPEHDYAWQMYTQVQLGATRLREGGVGRLRIV